MSKPFVDWQIQYDSADRYCMHFSSDKFTLLVPYEHWTRIMHNHVEINQAIDKILNGETTRNDTSVEFSPPSCERGHAWRPMVVSAGRVCGRCGTEETQDDNNKGEKNGP